MFYCPHCKERYYHPLDICPHCHTKVEPIQNKLKLLITAQDINEAILIEDILKTHGIKSLQQHISPGDYLTIYTGSSNYGINIFVLDSDFSAAKTSLSKSFPKYDYLTKESFPLSKSTSNHHFVFQLFKKALLISSLIIIALLIIAIFILRLV